MGRPRESWDDFCRIYERLIYDTALKSGLSDVESQEVVQKTLLAVAKKMGGFDYDPKIGTFRSWLLRITKRRIVDQFRKRKPDQETFDPERPPTEAFLTETIGGHRFEQLWQEEWHQALLEMA